MQTKKRCCKKCSNSCDYFGDLDGQDRCYCGQQSQVFTFEAPGKDVPILIVGNRADTRQVTVRRGCETLVYDPLALVNYLNFTFGAQIPTDGSAFIIPFDIIDACSQKIVGSFISIPVNPKPFLEPGLCDPETVLTNFSFDVWDYITLGPCKELLFKAVDSPFPCVTGTTEMRARIANVVAPVVDVCTETIQEQVYDHHNSIISRLVASAGFPPECGLPTRFGNPSSKTMILRINGNINASNFIGVTDPLKWKLTFDGIGNIKTANNTVV